MWQLPLDGFDVPKRPHSGLSFLDLPSSVRRHVYDAAGLLTGYTVDLSFPGRHRLPESSDASDDDESMDSVSYDWGDSDNGVSSSVCCGLTYNLLQTCRAIYNDIIPIIYSSNTFVIRRCALGGLGPLQNLSPNSIASLTHLVLYLKPSFDDNGHGCCNSRTSVREPFGSMSSADTATIEIWQQAATRLASYVQPHRLRLRATCDTQDYNTAEQIVAPFRQFPRLKSCHIRLGPRPDAVLRRLAEETAMYSTTGVTTNRFSSPFPFRSLPAELQIKVLSFSDLIAPCEIVWSPGRGFELLWPQRACGRFLGCYCRRYHAAFSPTCKCWEPPSALFLVNHAVRNVALEVFYSRNRFIVMPRHGLQPVHSTPPQVEASLFLKNFMPTSAIFHLRSLEIVFPPSEDGYLHSDSWGYQDWLSTLSHLARHGNLARLTLMIRMPEIILYGFPPLLRIQINMVLRMYIRVLRPLEGLTGLEDLYIALGYPMICGENVGEPERQRRLNYITTIEKYLEQMVMGGSYDSRARGKDRWLSRIPTEEFRRLTTYEDSSEDDF
ncbi:hypothetical protein VTN96DRAFT_10068 [Rasamsonia emersonii]|uniref:DUF7730 domain-containing protein n=1 Tax=Rasamsonia emersonii (strain ATCC 16479 / CBS 393.64 / IMI 116815) TaxID=1408163 RepID=A0A0F4YZG5_RASE3|nr:hypothetical protein T310_2917 [Rasamsonia emersonii CBS 393.64]KKA23038.1 hypothetical protein T310_2917 [Rasamsonia emersonii CBS 393.64]